MSASPSSAFEYDAGTEQHQRDPGAGTVLRQAQDAVHRQAQDAVHRQAQDAVHRQAQDTVHRQGQDAVLRQTQDAVHRQAQDAIYFTPVADELPPGQRWSTWDDIGISAGPEPWPDWLITADAAIDTDLGILKTGKEADVILLERATDDASVIMAAKRYRSTDHRLFHRDNGYTEGRRTRRSRDRRAVAKGTRWGRQVEAGEWASAEFGYLCDLWSAGLPVPYPVQLDGTEILMELITLADGSGAPRLAQSRPPRDVLEVYFAQLREAMCALARMGLAHGDLSAFNVLATDDHIVIIDLPQMVDIVGNPQGLDFLARDCRNVATWFSARGLEIDPESLLGEVIAYAW